MAQVGVDDADDLRFGRGEAFDHGRPQTELAGPVDHADREAAEGELVRHLPGPVRRIVVDDDELAVDAGPVVRGEDRAHQFGQPVAFVVGGHHEGERGRCGYAR